MRDTFVAELEAIAAEDPRIMLITGDLGFGVLTGYAQRRPHQYLNVGVAEQNLTGIAMGMALEGRVVFTYSIANFPTLRCLEQVRNDAAYHDADVKIVAIGGGFSYGQLGMSHHATEDLAILRAIPGITVIAPGDLDEVRAATRALVATRGTAYLRLDKTTATASPTAPAFTLGRARTLRDGDALTVIACGGILGEVLAVADGLAADEGVHVRVLSMHTVDPIDADAIVAAAQGTGGIVTVEEHVGNGGLGAAVAECCLDAGVMPRRFRRMHIGRAFVAVVGSQAYLRTHCGLDAASIRRSIAAVLRELP